MHCERPPKACPHDVLTVPSVTTRPLFGGYVLVAWTLAWLGGIALQAIGPIESIFPVVWPLVGAVAIAIATTLARLRSGSAGPRGRAMLLAAILLSALAVGGARAAWTDPANDSHAVCHLPQNAHVKLRGAVAAEPDVRGGLRHLQVDVSGANPDAGHTWQPAVGRIEVTLYGPDDWFATAYSDTLSLNGTFVVARSAGRTDVQAQMRGAQAAILARGGGNPVLAALFDLRVRLAEAIQRTLPEPEAALLIGILLGLKTPVLRSRLPLFIATGTIHLVVPAGLKVSLLAEVARRALRPLGRWPRLAGPLAMVALYAALGGGRPVAVRAAVMGALLVFAGSLGRRYNVNTALALTVLLMTAGDPMLIYDAGFQLTALATLGIPLLTPPVQRLLLALFGRLGRGIGVGVAELVAVTLAAQIATLPVLALTFGEVSLIAPIANLLTVPLLSPLLVIGSLAAGLGVSGNSLLGGLALVVGWVIWPMLWYVDNAIAVCASLPGAALAVSGIPVVAAWTYYALLALGGWCSAPILRRWNAASADKDRSYSGHIRVGRSALVTLLAISLLGAGGAAAPVLAAKGVLHLSFLNVGPGGAATLIRPASGNAVLLDGGPDGPALEGHSLANCHSGSARSISQC